MISSVPFKRGRPGRDGPELLQGFFLANLPYVTPQAALVDCAGGIALP